MLLYGILSIAAFLAGAFTAALILAIIGIRRGDRGKRLTGKPGSCAEVFARRMLTRSRGCDSREEAEAGR